jgi:hypothetical protein
LNIRRLGRSSDNEVYERVLKARKDKVLAALYWLVKHNDLYQAYEVVIDPSNIDWMGDDNEYVLPTRMVTLRMMTWAIEPDII